MLPPRSLLAALATAGAAITVALPATTASAAPTVDPTVCQLMNSPTGLFSPASLPGGASLADTLAKAGGTVGCAAPAPKPSQLPSFPHQR